ncbi:MAG: pyridoxamine 5'-phosphate oxidase family protein [Myxococcaceae bacterium]
MNQQRPKTSPSGDEKHAHRLHELMSEFETAMLVTCEAGEMFARPMTVAEVDPNNDVWFSTSINSPKSGIIRTYPQVLVTMQNDSRFVSIGGTCEISRDRQQIDRLWSNSWKIWFPQGKRDPSLALLRVHIENGEYWDLHGTHGLKFLWEAAKARFTGKKVETDPAGDHGKL